MDALPDTASGSVLRLLQAALLLLVRTCRAGGFNEWQAYVQGFKTCVWYNSADPRMIGVPQHHCIVFYAAQVPVLL